MCDTLIGIFEDYDFDALHDMEDRQSTACSNCGSQAKSGRRQASGLFLCWLCERMIG